MADYIIRATAAEGQVRAFAAHTTAMVEEEEKYEVKELIDFLKNPKKFTELGCAFDRVKP